MSLEQLSYVATIIGSIVTAVAAMFAFLAIKAASKDAKLSRDLASDVLLFETFNSYITTRPSFDEGPVGKVSTDIWNHRNSAGFLAALMKRRADEITKENPDAPTDAIYVQMLEQLKSTDKVAMDAFLNRWTKMSEAAGLKVTPAEAPVFEKHNA